MTGTLSEILDMLKYVIPALLIGAFMWYMFRKYTEAEERRRAAAPSSAGTVSPAVQSVPMRFQAYERMALLLERMGLASLVSRVRPYSDSVPEYVRLLTDHIEQEYEYNLSQQVYISDQAWKMVRQARRQTQELIVHVVKDGKPENVPEAQQLLIVYAAEHTLPSEKALDFIKSEVRNEF